MKVALIGHGMTGAWHARSLAAAGCELRVVAGRRAEPTREFARQHGFERWTVDVADILDDDGVDAVVVASPSEAHAEQAEQVLVAGKHCLVEIPLAMDAIQAERLVELARARGLRLGVVHPLRARRELVDLAARLADGTETLRQIGGRFYIHRLENVGASGYARSWTDNLLWHHLCHLVDAALWLGRSPVRSVCSIAPPIDERTGTPMEATVLIETEDDRSIVCSGSYNGRERIFEVLVITDRESYRLDVFAGVLTTGGGSVPILDEEANCALVVDDFVAAVQRGRAPLVDGATTLPALRALQSAQDAWDGRYGPVGVPGRPLPRPDRTS